jgi:hypothetical protein
MKSLINTFNVLKEKLKSKIKYKSLTKDDLIKKIYNCNKRHTIILSAMSLCNKNEFNLIFKNMYKNHEIDKLFPFVNGFRTKLMGNALRLEQETFLLSVKEVNKLFVKILDDLLNNIDKIIENDEISILNSRISIYTFMGILKQSEIVGIYSQFLFALVMELASNREIDIPKYRVIYMQKHYQIFLTAVNDICNTKGKYNFIKDMNIIRQKGVDYKIDPRDDSRAVLSVARSMDYSRQFNVSLSLFSVFSDMWSLIGESYIRYRNYKKERLDTSKEWLENRVALLKLDMSEVSSSSPEYSRLEKITKKYEDMISKLDRKISEYEE